ncbi:hypothetical protein [Caryophanon latum]|uniref:DUF4435 domain-containing protein n=1 Tax=Caryophanon latum TaxID=33977 RepID=A0A1C0YZF1_9BACL|nr:hypothetical protein [Caryophanon latum]OCS92560.1 hypothetical protein A6K76_06675 [Caryophanon latum]
MENSSRFFEISKEMVKYVYVEGTDYFFYQGLVELSDFVVHAAGTKGNDNSEVKGSSSSDVIRRVKDERKKGVNAFGIIDKDYNTEFDEYIYPIDFYCIENIALLNIEEFYELRRALEQLIEGNIGVYRLWLLELKLVRNADRRVETFEINKVRELSDNIKSYFESVINCVQTFMRYMNLKSLIVKYCDFHKQKYGKENQIKYKSNDLIGKLPESSLKYVFSDSTYLRFNADIEKIT